MLKLTLTAAIIASVEAVKTKAKCPFGYTSGDKPGGVEDTGLVELK